MILFYNRLSKTAHVLSHSAILFGLQVRRNLIRSCDILAFSRKYSPFHRPYRLPPGPARSSCSTLRRFRKPLTAKSWCAVLQLTKAADLQDLLGSLFKDLRQLLEL